MIRNTTPVQHGHESAAQAPQQTLDMVEQFGVGQKGTKDTGASMVARDLQVQATNPQARAGYGRAAEHQKDNLTARTVNVMARSGNQNPSQVMDSRVDHSFIWGGVGAGEEPTPMLGPSKPNWLLLGGLALGTFLLLRATGKMADAKMA